jgi:tetratricopeptide (TPR) repeat protein
LTETLDQLRASLSRRYLVERELGRGGMSTVYAAHDKRNNRDVAIKVFPPALAAAIGPERFKREIEITSNLSHPHILPLFDSGEAAGTMYYVMPLIAGESLRDRLDREVDGLPVSDVLALADQVAQALDYAHSLGVIHRDVTPDNILISNGNALLADFGVARLIQAESLTESGLPFGTAMYRSPEQAAGHARVGPPSDVYCLACVLYESLGGVEARPHLANRFSSPPPNLRKRKPEVTSAIDAALARAMLLDPAERFDSATDFVRALRSGMPLKYRWRSIGKVAAAILILGIGAAGFSIFRSHSSEPVRTRVLVGRFVNRTGDKSLDGLSEMTSDYIARGLAETGLIEVVDSRSIGSVSLASTRASTLIQGSVYRRGDQLHLETQILEPRSGKLLVAVDPIEGSSANATAIAEKLRQRLMGNFAAMFGPGFEAWESANLPPSFDAYQEILAGDASVGQNDYSKALEHYRRAAELDSSYISAKALAALAASIEGNCLVTDSIASALEKRRSAISQLDRGRIDWSAAQCHGELAKSFEAGKRVLASAPRSISFTLLTGVTALELLRPREALAILTSLSPEEMQFSASQRMFRTSFIGDSWHVIGDHERELEVLRDGLRSMPDEPQFITGELVALASLGRFPEITSRLDAIENGAARYDRELWNPGQMRLCIGTELKAHGFDRQADIMIVTAAKWSHLHLRATGALPVDIVCAHRLFVPQYYADMLNDAQRIYDAVLVHDSLHFEAHEGLGAIAAKRRDFNTLSRIDAWLVAHPSPEPGRTAYARARLFGIAGQTDRAMSLFEQSMNAGLKFRANIHADPDLAVLRRLPAYQRLLAIKG